MAVTVVGLTERAVPALLVFLASYAAPNLAAFAVVTHLRGRAAIDDYRRLARQRTLGCRDADPEPAVAGRHARDRTQQRRGGPLWTSRCVLCSQHGQMHTQGALLPALHRVAAPGIREQRHASLRDHADAAFSFGRYVGSKPTRRCCVDCAARCPDQRRYRDRRLRRFCTGHSHVRSVSGSLRGICWLRLLGFRADASSRDASAAKRLPGRLPCRPERRLHDGRPRAPPSHHRLISYASKARPRRAE